MEILERLDELSDIVETARSVPLSASCVIPREETLDLLDEIRAALPDAIREADIILRRREEIIEGVELGSAQRLAEAEARADRVVSEAMETAQRRVHDATVQAEQIIADARVQAGYLVDSHATTIAAHEEASRVLAEAQSRSQEILALTANHASAIFAKAESTLMTVVRSTRAEHAQIDAMAATFRADVSVHPDHDVVDLAARESRATRKSGGTEFYNLELDETVDHGQPPGFR